MVNLHRVALAPKDAGGPDPVELFQGQKVAMLPGVSSLASRLLAAKLPFKWAIAPLPAGKVAVSPISVSGLAISARSPNAQAALDFAAWIVGPAGSALKLNSTPLSRRRCARLPHKNARLPARRPSFKRSRTAGRSRRSRYGRRSKHWWIRR